MTFKKLKNTSLYVMSALYICAGLNHFWHPSFYVKIMPSYLPYHLELVYISGVFEIVCGLLLIPSATRKTSAWLTIALLVAVYPANIQMALNYYNENNPDFWISIVRLPIQFIFIWWAWIFTRNYNQKKRNNGF